MEVSLAVDSSRSGEGQHAQHNLMKFKIASLVAFAAVSNLSSAALVVGWDANNTPGPHVNPEPSPWDWDDNVIVSNMKMHGSVTLGGGVSPFVYRGFSASINPDNYIGFSVKPQDGFELRLTDMVYVQGGGIAGNTYAWGYRIDGGAWNMFTGEILLSGGTSSLKTFTFAQPIITTGEVEFGYFASTPSPNNDLTPVLAASNRNDVQINGTVNAVPEPTAALLGAGGMLAAILRRRRA